MAGMLQKLYYTALWALDPHLKRMEQDIEVGDVHWQTIELPARQTRALLADQECEGFIYKDRRPPKDTKTGHTWVHIHELLWTVIRWETMYRFRVVFKGWSSFLHMLQDQRRAEIFKNYDLVFGGADLMLDLSDTPYELPSHGADYIRLLKEISEVTVLWPPISDVRSASKKWDTIQHLDDIAEHVTKTSRPWTRLEAPLHGSSFVLKREGSDGSRHRFFDPPLHDAQRMLRKRGQYRWMAQQLIEPLRSCGEIRVYVIGGKVHSWVITCADGDSWSVSADLNIASLDEMKLSWETGQNKDWLLLSDGGVKAVLKENRRFMRSFVYKTYEALRTRERKGDELLSIDHLARVDISVMSNSEGQFDYFVNKVERGVGVCKFFMGSYQATTKIIDEWGLVMQAWMDGLKTYI
ncbi:hypothetical protein BOTBODRAFT_181438 [Botryobasidium botryosum FD-172 SS1]|uniref:Uncharacterized protein n=1 Tax=Botryobasidium botryosum (strain FD-172 SS1) TaxID=930990 RepID=A0A067LWE3_BOTB1|nr:hypothetical protein BOTBODRAFT_181438 [Botryobasidium botryosum FD-172 SS1]